MRLAAFVAIGAALAGPAVAWPEVVTPDPIPTPIHLGGLALEAETLARLPADEVLDGMAVAPDDSGRLFLRGRAGRIWLLRDGALAESPFLDLPALLGADFVADQRRGLQGLAFHPDFARPGRPGHGRLYTVYSANYAGFQEHPDTRFFPSPLGYSDHHDLLCEWRVMAGDPDRVDPASRREILRIGQPGSDRNAGGLAFGPDGLLYLALGDGGGPTPELVDPYRQGQRTATPLGAVLRIDPLERADAAYRVPADNPFLGDPDFLPEIWAYGFREPVHLAFDRRAAGALLVSDVGQANVEEVNRVVAGANQGWSLGEGSFAVEPTDAATLYRVESVGSARPAWRDPLAQYDHDEGGGIAGALVYRGERLGPLRGQLVIADRESGRLFRVAAPGGELRELALREAGTARSFRELVGGGAAGLHLGEDGDGELYLLSETDGSVRRLVASELSGQGTGLRGWYVFQDGHGSRVEFPEGRPGPYADVVARLVKAAQPPGGAGEPRYVGLGAPLRESGAPLDLGPSTGLVLEYQLAGPLELVVLQQGVAPAEAHRVRLRAHGAMARARIDWSLLRQPEWVAIPTSLDRGRITGLQLEVPGTETGESRLRLRGLDLGLSEPREEER